MAEIDSTPATNGIISSANGLISALWERTADSLTNEELADVSRIGEYATMQARHLREVIEGVGCLIGCDTKSGVGSFQDGRGVSTLLFSIAHQIDTIAAMLEVSGAAEFRLAHPEIYK